MNPDTIDSQVKLPSPILLVDVSDATGHRPECTCELCHSVRFYRATQPPIPEGPFQRREYVVQTQEFPKFKVKVWTFGSAGLLLIAQKTACTHEDFQMFPDTLECEGFLFEKRSFAYDGVIYATKDVSMYYDAKIPLETAVVTLCTRKMPNASLSIVLNKLKHEIAELEEELDKHNFDTDRVLDETCDVTVCVLDLWRFLPANIQIAVRRKLMELDALNFTQLPDGTYKAVRQTSEPPPIDSE